MLRGLMIRRIIAGCLILIFVAAVITANSRDPLVFFAGAVLGLTGLIDPFLNFWDRFRPAATTRRPPSADAVRDVNAYLEGCLRQFEAESQSWVDLAGDTIIPTIFSSATHQFEAIQQAVDLHQGRFVLIGEPGAGKSTTLRQLMIQAIRDYHLETSPRLPVWINLGLSGTPIEANGLLQFWWDEQAYLPGTPDQYIQQDAVCLFMDGLNEMPLDSRADRAKALKAFLDKHPTLPVIVTCHLRDYEDDEKLNLGLPIVRVQPLDEERIQAFITKRGASADLWDKIRSNDALRRMAANPHKLGMLIAVYQAGHELSENLAELYDHYVNVAYRIRAEQANTPLLHLTWPKLEVQLKRLAFWMIKERHGTAASVEWARRKIGHRALTDGINLGVLSVAGKHVKFNHQSWQGYFAADQLGQALKTPAKSKPQVVAVIQQIGDLGEAGMPALEPLLGALGASSQEIRHSAAQALGQLGPSAVEPLMAALSDTHSSVRSGAAMALTRLKDHRSLGSLLVAVDDSDWEVRREAAFALGALDDERAIKGLTQRLGDAHPQVRHAVVFALWQLRASPPVDALIEALKDPAAPVRRASVAALTEIGAVEAVDGLVEALRDSDNTTRLDIIFALKQFGAKSTQALLRLLSDEDHLVRAVAAEALGNLGDPRAVGPLIRTLNDPADEVRINTAEALGNLGDPRALGPLIGALNDYVGRVRENAVGALGKLNDARAIEPLIAALSDTNLLVQIRVVNVLAAIKAPQAVEPLTRLLTNNGSYMERKAVLALREIGTPEALAAVEQWIREQQLDE